MTIELTTPRAADLADVAAELGRWQPERWPGCLHPGDLGWHSLVGAEQTAADLRIWTRDGGAVAVGMLDGADLIRLAVDPSLTDDEEVADQVRNDLSDPNRGVLEAGEAAVEARGAGSLRRALQADGWVDDEPWTPLQLDLSGSFDLCRLDRANVRIESVGPREAGDWIEVHWSSFKASPLDEATRIWFTDRWRTMATGPFAELAHHLIAFAGDDAPVAVTSVWTAGSGRPGLIEPMGVARDRQGSGYGVAITLAGAQALQRAGASSAVVVAENSNPGALATYVASGFTPGEPVTDLKRPAT